MSPAAPSKASGLGPLCLVITCKGGQGQPAVFFKGWRSAPLREVWSPGGALPRHGCPTPVHCGGGARRVAWAVCASRKAQVKVPNRSHWEPGCG